MWEQKKKADPQLLTCCLRGERLTTVWFCYRCRQARRRCTHRQNRPRRHRSRYFRLRCPDRELSSRGPEFRRCPTRPLAGAQAWQCFPVLAAERINAGCTFHATESTGHTRQDAASNYRIIRCDEAKDRNRQCTQGQRFTNHM